MHRKYSVPRRGTFRVTFFLAQEPALSEVEWGGKPQSPISAVHVERL